MNIPRIPTLELRDLPEEMLDHIVRFCLPVPKGHLLPGYEGIFYVDSSLRNLSLVSRTFYRLVLPYLHRYLQWTGSGLKLPYYHRNAILRERKMCMEVINRQMESYEDAPTRLQSIRFLALDHYPFEWIPGHIESLSSEDLLWFRSLAILSLDLEFGFPEDSGWSVLQEFLAGCYSLQTLVIKTKPDSDDSILNWEELADSCQRIKTLYIKSPHGYVPLSYFSSLETLGICHISSSIFPYQDPFEAAMPLETLREIHITGILKWSTLLDNYKNSLKKRGITTFPLKELVIQPDVSYDIIGRQSNPSMSDWCIEPSHLRRLLVTFTNHPLRKLVLTLVNDFEPALLRDIFVAIPALEELGLIHSDPLTSESLEHYAQVLREANTQNLHMLAWDVVFEGLRFFPSYWYPAEEEEPISSNGEIEEEEGDVQDTPHMDDANVSWRLPQSEEDFLPSEDEDDHSYRPPDTEEGSESDDTLSESGSSIQFACLEAEHAIHDYSALLDGNRQEHLAEALRATVLTVGDACKSLRVFRMMVDIVPLLHGGPRLASPIYIIGLAKYTRGQQEKTLDYELQFTTNLSPLTTSSFTFEAFDSIIYS